MERLARRVEREGDFAACDVHVEHDVGAVEAYAGSALVAEVVAEPVHDAVFHAVSHELGVAELFAERYGVDSESLSHRHQRAPVELFYLGVQLVGVGGVEGIERFENTQSGTAAEVCFIEHCEVAAKGYHAFAGLHILCAQGS